LKHYLVTRPNRYVARSLGALVLVTIATAPPRAQMVTSSDFRVSVTVARSCTLSSRTPTAEAAEGESLVSVTCAEGATPAPPHVSVDDDPTRNEQDPQTEISTPAQGTSTTLVVVNF
jgi:hypothetical protein